MDENAKTSAPVEARAVTREALVRSALLSAARAEDLGMGRDQIILSAKVSAVQDLISVYRELARRGYQAGKPVLVQVATVQAMRAASAAVPAETADAPDAAWAALFLAEGFDPVDGASRVKALSRARGSVYASVRENGKTVAAGAGAFSHGWSSVHGMRTDQACRGRGLAGRVLVGIADVAQQRGITRAFLQVEDANASARALYRRAGFETVWSYDYWARP